MYKEQGVGNAEREGVYYCITALLCSDKGSLVYRFTVKRGGGGGGQLFVTLLLLELSVSNAPSTKMEKRRPRLSRVMRLTELLTV